MHDSYSDFQKQKSGKKKVAKMSENFTGNVPLRTSYIIYMKISKIYKYNRNTIYCCNAFYNWCPLKKEKVSKRSLSVVNFAIM